jgi:hypothetical protein
MRRFALLCGTALMMACAKTDQPAADTAAATPAPPPTPPPIQLSDVAGRWNVVGKNQAGDSTLVTYVVNATADTSGWTIVFPNRPPVPMRVVAVAGDSIVLEAGPYASVLRRGVQVRTIGAVRLVDGKLVGMQTARYTTRGPDSVLVVRTEGTRVP